MEDSESLTAWSRRFLPTGIGGRSHLADFPSRESWLGSCLPFIFSKFRAQVADREDEMTCQEMLTETRASRTDLARFVEAASHDERPYLIVPARAVEGWQEREPQIWAKVRGWLASQGKSLVVI